MEGPAANEGEIFQTARPLLRGHLVPAPGTTNLNSRGLSLPVLPTKRRPCKRSRGFICAYSPLLNNAGIDQKIFLDLIDNFNKAVRTNGLIQALNLASIAGLAALDPIDILIGIAVQIATNIADEMDSRSNPIRFLDKINDSFFAPRVSVTSNHPVSSGDPLALVTGGRAQIFSIPLLFLARKNSEPTLGDGSSKPLLADLGTFGKAKNVALLNPSDSLTLLQTNILYLMITNRPTRQQFAEASDILRTIH
ncbi:hypothetical protein BHYA_0155g00260 [Botrytis hyacinthi]|uniref:Uncharacterized protein n=1 Tax=Botrytis hyacinthi TaxID=278943 RepID=A0A4Z1GFP4_9HELO|nr:hypothetical protein BHYA_0155g00260 [Botrytis hyacinthi]